MTEAGIQVNFYMLKKVFSKISKNFLKNGKLSHVNYFFKKNYSSKILQFILISTINKQERKKRIYIYIYIRYQSNNKIPIITPSEL